MCNLHYEKFADGTVKCIEDEIPFELPEGWAWERLSNLATFSGGKTPSTSNREYWEGNILWVTSKDMKCKYIDSSLLMISEKGLINHFHVIDKHFGHIEYEIQHVENDRQLVV